MKGKFVITEIDRGWKQIRASLKALKDGDSYVKVGVLGTGSGMKNRERTGPVTNVDLAVIHEFGAPSANIPERSFIRSSFDANRHQYIADLRKLMTSVYENKMTVARALGIMGLRMSTDMKKRITTGDGISPANTPEVFMRKLLKNTARFNKTGAAPRPLVDTGRLVGSISHEVVLSGVSRGEAQSDVSKVTRG